MSVHIYARESWNAFPPNARSGINNVIHPILNVASTYTNSKPCYGREQCMKVVYNLQYKALKLKFQEDIYYSFLIGGDGNVYEGRGWWRTPILPFRYRFNNKDTLYIAFIGQFLDKRPPDIMRKARYDLIQHGLAMNYIDEKYEKRDLSEEASEILRELERR